MSFSAKDKAEALRRLEADLQADDITIEEYSREETRIQAGSSRSTYLTESRRGLIERALHGDTAAQVKLAIRVAVAVVIVVILLVVISAAASVVVGEGGGFGPVPSGEEFEGFEGDDD